MPPTDAQRPLGADAQRIYMAPTATGRPAEDPAERRRLLTTLCAKFGACFCSIPPAEYWSHTSHSVRQAYHEDANRLKEQLSGIQYSASCTTHKQYDVIFPAYGLGGSILDHIKRLLPIWQHALRPEGAGKGSVGGVAVPTRYTHFAGNQGDTNAYLWATFDDTLPCRSWYGCYWHNLSSPRSCPTAASLSPAELKMPTLNSTAFERRWGATLLSAALLNAWWRPTEELQREVDRGVRRVFRGGGGSVGGGFGGGGFGGGTSGLAHGDAPGTGGLRCVALHVRRGDACPTSWRHCPALEQFLVAARVMARRYSLNSIFVASEDSIVISQVLDAMRTTKPGSEPWSTVFFQEYDRAPLSQPMRKQHGTTRYWVEQRLRYAKPGERPLGRRPILEFLVDVEAASRCRAIVGTMDSHGTHLMLLRMASRHGAVPPFYSLVAPLCPMTRIPADGPAEERAASVCDTRSDHTLVLPGNKTFCPGLAALV